MTEQAEEKLIQWGKDLESKHPKEVLAFALNNISGDVVFLTAFGPEGCVVMAMLKELLDEGKITNAQVSIANLDTGYQFAETIDLKNRLEAKYGFKVNMFEPELSVQEQDEKYMKDLYKKHPDQCCYLRKVLPLEKLLKTKAAWITGIRRDQTEHRASAMAIEWDAKFNIGKINPLVSWTKSDVWKYIHENQVPYNELLDQGYDSIGCEPCTKPGQGRAGRWAGKDKIECGLHVQEQEKFSIELHEGESI